MRAGPGLWMPFTSHDHDWVVKRFSKHGLIQRAQWIAAIARTEPVVRAEFNVHHGDGHLLYTADECSDEDIESVFFVHVFPVNEDDLPAGRLRHGFDNLDFRFKRRRLPDGALVASGAGCAALRRLPGYEVARIRTGQLGLRQTRLWDREFDLVDKTPGDSG